MTVQLHSKILPLVSLVFSYRAQALSHSLSLYIYIQFEISYEIQRVSKFLYISLNDYVLWVTL